MHVLFSKGIGYANMYIKYTYKYVICLTPENSVFYVDIEVIFTKSKQKHSEL